MSNYLMVVIDDLRTVKDPDNALAETDLRYARTSAEGISLLTELIEAGTVVDEVWLDHDLGPDDNSRYGYDTIMPVVSYLEELGAKGQAHQIGCVYIHTMNVSAVPAMQEALRPHYQVVRVNATDFFTSADWHE